ncbi:hypothetical protein SVA_0028 [Sulfurifustis variabilis]|uniref:Uncharacterized protein n=1 Tax=Sulfurifustis variabilis TaxID=1675686 RepID=A0A1B4V9X8_9GAMM|nr:hypothetical protein [Sulfurifustis variabilis]BAU46611.1 hypothetical protein SVA_0028 [Sulfurifustis variabilis]
MLATFLRICLLRANPQDLPASNGLLALALLAHVAADVLSLRGMVDLRAALQAGVVDTVLLVALAHTALLLRNHPDRARQTLTALAGCGALLTLLSHAAVTLAQPIVAPPVTALPFIVWFVLVYGHILRHALSIGFGLAAGFGLAYLFVSVLVTSAFLPIPPPEPV